MFMSATVTLADTQLSLIERVCPCENSHDPTINKKVSDRRGTARCVVSVKILPIATQQCRNSRTSPEQIEVMKLEC